MSNTIQVSLWFWGEWKDEIKEATIQESRNSFPIVIWNRLLSPAPLRGVFGLTFRTRLSKYSCCTSAPKWAGEERSRRSNSSCCPWNICQCFDVINLTATIDRSLDGALVVNQQKALGHDIKVVTLGRIFAQRETPTITASHKLIISFPKVICLKGIAGREILYYTYPDHRWSFACLLSQML